MAIEQQRNFPFGFSDSLDIAATVFLKIRRGRNILGLNREHLVDAVHNQADGKFPGIKHNNAGSFIIDFFFLPEAQPGVHNGNHLSPQVGDSSHIFRHWGNRLYADNLCDIPDLHTVQTAFPKGKGQKFTLQGIFLHPRQLVQINLCHCTSLFSFYLS